MIGEGGVRMSALLLTLTNGKLVFFCRGAQAVQFGIKGF